jgi:hypothetical protein
MALLFFHITESSLLEGFFLRRPVSWRKNSDSRLVFPLHVVLSVEHVHMVLRSRRLPWQSDLAEIEGHLWPGTWDKPFYHALILFPNSYSLES